MNKVCVWTNYTDSFYVPRGNEPFVCMKIWEFFDQLTYYPFLKWGPAPWN